MRNNSLSADLDIDLNSALSFELDASMSDFRFDRTATTSTAWINTDEVSIDPRLRFSGRNGIEALIGLHYYKADQDEFIQLIAPQNFEDTTETKAIYGEVTILFASAFELSLGARYEEERRERSGGDAAGAIAAIDSDRTFDVFLPRLGLNWEPVAGQNYGLHVSKGYNAGGGGIAFGFPNPFPIVPYEYGTETVWNYEIYGRQELMGGALQLTQNIFVSNYDNMQLPFDLTPNDSLDELFVVRNADEVITYGAEFGATYQVSDDLGVYGNLGQLQTDTKSFPGSGVEGNELFNAPTTTATLGVNWSPNNWNLSLAARYSSGYFTGINNRPRGETSGSVVADMNVSYQFENFRIFMEAKNLFDNQDAIALYPGATSATDSAVLRQPREIRVGVATVFQNMATFTFDDHHWPFCVTRAEGRQTLDQHLDMLAVWDRWLDRETPFIVFRQHVDVAAIDQVPGVAKATKSWLANGAGEKIRLYVRAMCIFFSSRGFGGTSKAKCGRRFWRARWYL